MTVKSNKRLRQINSQPILVRLTMRAVYLLRASSESMIRKMIRTYKCLSAKQGNFYTNTTFLFFVIFEKN